jgi:dolichyl-phosphate-mannose-protein mannosyltransferase
LTCWQLFPVDIKVAEDQKQRYLNRKKTPSLAFEDYLYDGDHLRLKHCYSKVALAASDLVSIGSNKTFIREVRGLKWVKQPSVETTWRVELVSEGAVPGLANEPGFKAESVVEGEEEGEKTAESRGQKEKRKQWRSIKGFRLFNEKLNCYLMSHKVFRSPYSTYQEVGCIQGNRQKANTIFVIDRNVNPNRKNMPMASRPFFCFLFFSPLLPLLSPDFLLIVDL